MLPLRAQLTGAQPVWVLRASRLWGRAGPPSIGCELSASENAASRSAICRIEIPDLRQDGADRISLDQLAASHGWLINGEALNVNFLTQREIHRLKPRTRSISACA
jgi:hypothetical protein